MYVFHGVFQKVVVILVEILYTLLVWNCLFQCRRCYTSDVVLTPSSTCSLLAYRKEIPSCVLTLNPIICQLERFQDFCFDFLRFSVRYHVICKQRQFDFLFFSLYALFPFLVLLYQLELEYGNTVVWGDILALFLTGARNFQLMMSTVSFTYSLSIWGTCSQNVAQTVLKFVILQTQTPKCWILTV